MAFDLMNVSAAELTIRRGKTLKAVELATALVIGGKHVAEQMKEAGFALAVKKAENGNYRAAVEILALGVTAGTVKALAPEEGKFWTKNRVGLLAEKVMERPSGAKGYSKAQRSARTMAQIILKDEPKGDPLTIDAEE